MEINIHNYESVLIDYFDGNLNALEVAEVLLFLEQHPDLKNEFEGLGTLPEPETLKIEPDFKSQLKKLNGEDLLAKKSLNELLVAQMEGDCSTKENELINELISGNSAFIKLKNTFLLTRLMPDSGVTYPHKNALKRREAVVFYLNRKFASAAAILLLASLLFLVYRNTNKNIEKDELVHNNEAIVPEQVPVESSQKKIVQPLQKHLAASVKKEVKKVASLPSKNTLMTVVTENNNFRKYTTLAFIQIKPIVTSKKAMALEDKKIEGEIIPVEQLAFNTVADQDNFLSISDWMKKQLIDRSKNNLVENEKPVNTENLTIEPITIASVGAGIVEKTTGKKVLLARSFDKAGTIKSYTFAAGNFKFERIK